MAFVNKEYLLKAFDAFNDAEHAPKGWISAMNTAREIVEDAPMICTGMFGRWLAYDENGEPTEGEAARRAREEKNGQQIEFTLDDFEED